MGRVLVWFRRDLRWHDQRCLAWAASAGEVAGVYVFGWAGSGFGGGGGRDWARLGRGFVGGGEWRRGFEVESVGALRAVLAARGVGLVLRAGLAAEEVVQLALDLGVETVVWSDEAGWDEGEESRAVARGLRSAGIGTKVFLQDTLVDLGDLPYGVEQLPLLFTRFRQDVERGWRVRGEVTIDRMVGFEVGRGGELPEVRDGGRYRGGEESGLARLREWVWERDRLRRYKETRNGMLEEDDSSKFSPWLAWGCLSPRRVYGEVKRYEGERAKNDSTYWLVFELLWRDYFHFLARREGRRLFLQSGVQGLDLGWSGGMDRFWGWAEGRTGFPVVDAGMRELAATGYLSNRGRQIVASFLTKVLDVDWRLGALWFEHQLVDYDVASNYGNWQYAAGVGTDGREFRVFHPVKQGETYDPDGRYVRRWLPELRVMGKRAHSPWAHEGGYIDRMVDFSLEVERNRSEYLRRAKVGRPEERVRRDQKVRRRR